MATEKAKMPETAPLDEVEVLLTGGKQVRVPVGTPLLDLSREHPPADGTAPLLALMDDMPTGLQTPIVRDARLEFVGITHMEGFRAYRRTLIFLLIRAMKDLYPDERLRIEHALKSGYYCHVHRPLDKEEIPRIRNRMSELVAADLPIRSRELPLDRALSRFEVSNEEDKVQVFRYLGEPTVVVHELEGLTDYFYGPLLHRTGLITVFKVVNHPPGFLLCFPERAEPFRIPPLVHEPKLLRMLRDQERWGRLLGITNVGTLNELTVTGRISEFIKVNEAQHEKKIAQIADRITGLAPVPRIVLISGPTAAGKTTFCKRLAIHLRVNGLRVETLSLDNYFVDRDHTPRDEAGDFDFEHIEALDLPLLNQNLTDLLDGRRVEIPHFSFALGHRKFRGDTLHLESDSIVLIEGIHALNPRLTESVERTQKFLVYVSALTQMNLDDHNRVPTTDVRICRRTVRDHRFRGYTARDTLSRWSSIRRGEKTWVFPFQEEADAMFNTSLSYELAALKTFAEPLYRQIPPGDPTYRESRRLRTFLSFFLPIPMDEVPPTSFLREFVGGSSFRY